MLYHLVIATVIIVGLTLVWIGVQALVRRRSAGTGEEDVLACTLCSAGGLCVCGLRDNRDGRLRPSPLEREEAHR